MQLRGLPNPGTCELGKWQLPVPVLTTSPRASTRMREPAMFHSPWLHPSEAYGTRLHPLPCATFRTRSSTELGSTPCPVPLSVLEGVRNSAPPLACATFRTRSSTELAAPPLLACATFHMRSSKGLCCNPWPVPSSERPHVKGSTPPGHWTERLPFPSMHSLSVNSVSGLQAASAGDRIGDIISHWKEM